MGIIRNTNWPTVWAASNTFDRHHVTTYTVRHVTTNDFRFEIRFDLVTYQRQIWLHCAVDHAQFGTSLPWNRDHLYFWNDKAACSRYFRKSDKPDAPVTMQRLINVLGRIDNGDQIEQKSAQVSKRNHFFCISYYLPFLSNLLTQDKVIGKMSHTMTKRGKRRKTRKEKNLLERMAMSVKNTNLPPRHSSQLSQAKLVSMLTRANRTKIKKEFKNEKLSPQRKLSSQTYRYCG